MPEEKKIDKINNRIQIIRSYILKDVLCLHTDNNRGASSVFDILVGLDEDISPC